MDIALWNSSGFKELIGARQRYRIVNKLKATAICANANTVALQNRIIEITEKYLNKFTINEPFPFDAIAIGKKKQLHQLQNPYLKNSDKYACATCLETLTQLLCSLLINGLE